MGFLDNKNILITGIASERSIAWGTAQAMAREGANLAFSYQSDKLKKRVDNAAEQFGSKLVLPLDAGDDGQIAEAFTELSKHWDGLDAIVHSMAFAPRDHLEGGYLDNLTREGFAQAHDISSYTLAALARAGLPMMRGRKAALVTMTYLGAVRVVPNYNVMGVAKASLEANVRYLADCLGPEGIRVNAVSAGPIRTLAASGIKNFKSMLEEAEGKTPLRRNVTIEEVGNAAAFLCSDLASGITGDILYVDSGYHILGA
jgi:enoyl-[acyl-carrier protein] reductase I